jgi:hypothetical protein
MVTNFSQRAIVDKMRGIRRDRAQHLGRPRNGLARRAQALREGARATSTSVRRRSCSSTSRATSLRASADTATARVRGGARLRRREGRSAALAAYLARRAPEGRTCVGADEPFFMRPPTIFRAVGRQTAGRRVRGPVLRSLRRAHSVTLQRPGCGLPSSPSMWRSSASAYAPSSSRPGRQGQNRRLGCVCA